MQHWWNWTGHVERVQSFSEYDIDGGHVHMLVYCIPVNPKDILGFVPSNYSETTACIRRLLPHQDINTYKATQPLPCKTVAMAAPDSHTSPFIF